MIREAMACSHYRKPSMIKAKLIKAMNITASLSKREKMRRKLFKRRNSCSTSRRRLYISRSYPQRSTHVRSGGTTGMKPRSSVNFRVSPPSYALSIRRYSGRFSGPGMSRSVRPHGKPCPICLERRRAERNRDFRPGTRISSGWKRSLPAYLAGTTCAKYLMPFGQAPGWRANPSLTFQSRRLTAPA